MGARERFREKLSKRDKIGNGHACLLELATKTYRIRIFAIISRFDNKHM